MHHLTIRLLLLFAFNAYVAHTSHNLNPIVIVPSYGGTSLTYQQFAHGCSTGTSKIWYDSANYASTDTMKCWMDRFRTVYNPMTRSSLQAPGIRVQPIVSRSGLDGIVNVTPPELDLVSDWQYVIASLQSIGYTPGMNIVASPYDWRFGPTQIGPFMNQTRVLVEHMYAQTGKQVILLTCSIGSVYTYIFMKTMGRQWVNLYIRSFISQAAPYGGAFRFIPVYTTFDTPLHPFIAVQRTWPVTPFMLPNAAVYGSTWFP